MFLWISKHLASEEFQQSKSGGVLEDEVLVALDWSEDDIA